MSPLRLPTSLEALTETRFRLLWAGQATSAIGDGLMSIALAFAVLKIGGSTRPELTQPFAANRNVTPARFSERDRVVPGAVSTRPAR
jgi:hypothetical protein